MRSDIETWSDALNRLKNGNQRFVNGLRSIEALSSPEKLTTLHDTGQAPYAVILTCSDSRVPVELVFDEGLGELFVIRVAGNVVQSSQIASIEYAVANLNVKLCLIMGHSKCGAVQAAVDCEERAQVPDSDNLTDLINLIRPAVQRCKSRKKTSGASDILAEAIQENVTTTRALILEKSPLLRNKMGTFEIVESFFDMKTGIVKFKV